MIEEHQENKFNLSKVLTKTRIEWFDRIGSLFKSYEIDDDLWDYLEEVLISSDIGVDATYLLLDRLKSGVRDKQVTQVGQIVKLLKNEISNILKIEDSTSEFLGENSPMALLVVGVNGAGKTTSIAKLAKLCTENGKKVLLGAADTYRAGAIEQLQIWGKRLGVDVISHEPGADPGSVAFDTLQAASARRSDVVIIDTAGRLHTKVNLMEELKKIQRVVSNQGYAQSQRVLLVLDATTGQNGISQARSFIDAVNCDGVFLTKLDGTAKGGIAVAVAVDLKLPVIYIGTGEKVGDIALFNHNEFTESVFGA